MDCRIEMCGTVDAPRPEMQDFLRGRPMVSYQEPWMGRIDAMKKFQSWTDTPITHFQEFASFGERSSSSQGMATG